MLTEMWKNALNEVTKPEQFAFPHDVMNTLNDAYALAQLELALTRNITPEQERIRRRTELQLRLKRALD